MATFPVKPSKRLIATDVISPFHLISCLSIGLINNCNDIYIYTAPKIDGTPSHKKIVFKNSNVKIHIQELEHRNRFGLSTLYKFVLYLFSAGREKKIIFSHNNYLKPTLLNFIKFNDIAKCDVWIFEEGLGFYGDWAYHKNVARREGINFAFFKYFSKFFLKKLVKNRHQVLSGSALSPETLVVKKFKEAIDLYCNIYPISQEMVLDKLKNDSVVYFTSPYVDVFCCDKNKYKEHINRLKFQFDGRLLIKPHPLEKKSLAIYESLGVPVIDKSVSAEQMFFLNRDKISLVVGSYTAALLIAKNIFSIDIQIIPAYDELGLAYPEVRNQISGLFS